MEAADDAATLVAPLGRLIVCAENGFAWAAGGAEKGSHGLGEEVQVAQRRCVRRDVGAQALAQASRGTGTGQRYGRWLEFLHPAAGEL